MRPTSSHVIYRHRTDLFQNKCEAMALKRVVKACFAPHFVYEHPEQTKKQVPENGPTFTTDNYAKPRVDRSLRCSPKAFVSKKLKHKVCQLLKKQISYMRQQTKTIDSQLRNTHQPSFKELSSLKNSSRSTTNRSFNEPEPKRTLFRLNS